MAEKSQESLINFMKKQASNKVSKQNGAKKSTSSLNGDKTAKDKDDKETDVKEEEMTDEEKLEEAKKESRGKLANVDQTEMFKKLILESTAKYVLLIALLVLGAIGLIEGAPMIFEFFHGLFFKVLLGSAK